MFFPKVSWVQIIVSTSSLWVTLLLLSLTAAAGTLKLYSCLTPQKMLCTCTKKQQLPYLGRIGCPCLVHLLCLIPWVGNLWSRHLYYPKWASPPGSLFSPQRFPGARFSRSQIFQKPLILPWELHWVPNAPAWPLERVGVCCRLWTAFFIHRDQGGEKKKIKSILQKS